MSPRTFVLAFLLLYGVVLSVGLRFEVPFHRPWEQLVLDDNSGFAPSTRVETIAVGDLGHEAGIPSLRVPRLVRFTTDAAGFRNPTFEEPPQVVTVGDSFTAGAGLDDADTLARQLAAKTGLRVYNRGAGTLAGPAHYLSDGRFFRRPPGVVVYCPSQRGLDARSLKPVSRSLERTEPSLWPRPSELLGPGAGDAIRRTLRRVERYQGLSRLAIDSLGEVRFRLLGHPWVGVAEGAPALRLPARTAGFDRADRVEGVDATVAMVRRFAGLVAQRGVALVFCPIPDAGDVYPELYSEAARRRFVNPPIVDRVVAAARRAGLRVVDLPALFRAHRSPYLYWRDDSHWAPHAVALTAEALAPVVQRLAEGGGG